MARIALTADGPNTAVIRIAITSDGKANTRSLLRMMISSKMLPRFAAAARPSGMPSAIPIPTASTATPMEVRAPTISIDSTSLPK